VRRTGVPDLSFFLSILLTLERINAPYMIIGAFAGNIYGVNRATYDIDIVVDLSDDHVQALADAYPLPRYYADPQQMRDSIQLGIMFNIIDTSRGEKADLVPLSMELRYRQALQFRVRQAAEIPGSDPLEVWCARAEDVILGKLMAWAESRSRRHETDIYEMVVAYYEGIQPDLDERRVDSQVQELGAEIIELWGNIKEAARRRAQ
jgi:hypothetical protein